MNSNFFFLIPGIRISAGHFEGVIDVLGAVMEKITDFFKD
jgi:orotidine-5'-phosphate decarboxylase